MTAPLKDLQILQTKSVGDLVREEIIGRIKRGDLMAGDKLSELSLAQQFAISRAPVREAFRALEEAGLVRLEKNRGVFVRRIEEPEAQELYALRATLDEMAGGLLAPRMNEVTAEELEGWLARLAEAARIGDMKAYFPLNIAFHDRLVELTENHTLIEFYRKVIDRMHLLRRRNFDEGQGSQASQDEHRAIVAALRTGQPKEAAQAMREHVIKGYERLRPRFIG
jgi:DNA-binding GntR family transcriptional regulator